MSLRFVWTSLCLIGIFPFQSAQAYDADSFVLGIVKKDTKSGLLTNFCNIGSGRTHIKGDALVATKLHICTNKNDAQTSEFYEVVVNDDLVFVEKDALFIGEASRKLLGEIGSEQRESFLLKSKETAKVLSINEIEDVLKAVKKTAAQGLTLLSYSPFDVSEHTEGTGFQFEVINPTKKTIKYVIFSLVGLNAVKDPVRTINGSKTTTVRGIGPIQPEGNGSYSFDYVWHTDLVESVRVVSIKVDYMDGSTRTISNASQIELTSRQVNALSKH